MSHTVKTSKTSYLNERNFLVRNRFTKCFHCQIPDEILNTYMHVTAQPTLSEQ